MMKQDAMNVLNSALRGTTGCASRNSSFRLFRAVWTFAMLALLAVPFASAQLSRFGPINDAGYPSWYQDQTGLAMEFCENQTQAELNGAWCLLLPRDVPSGAAPESFPNNFGQEHFFWSLNSGARRVPLPNGQTVVVLLDAGLEGAFANGSVKNGDQIAFARVRIKINPVPYDGDYTVYTPFGKFVFANQQAGQKRGLFFTEDVGLSPGDFALALNGRIGPFLLPSTSPGGPEMPPVTALNPTPDTDPAHFGGAFAPTPYPGTGKSYIADPARIGPVTGSALSFTINDGTLRNGNMFRVEGPNGFVFDSTDFSVAGRVYEGPMAGSMQAERASYSQSATANKLDVFATATPNSQGRLPAQPQPPATSTQMSFYDAPCTATLDNQGNPGPPYSAPAGANLNQMFSNLTDYFGESAPALVPPEVCIQYNSVNASGQAIQLYAPAQVADQVNITQAVFDPVSHNLAVRASSSDRVNAQTLTVQGFGNIPVGGSLVLNNVLAVPEKLTVFSSGGGRNQRQVISGTVAAGGVSTTPIAANDSILTLEDTAVSVPVLNNDSNVAGNVVTVAVVSPATLGTASANADGTITYTPKLNANGSDSFTYKVTVDGVVSNEATVSVSITPVNDAPTANPDNVGALRGQRSSVNVLANDTDPDGQSDLAAAVIINGNAGLGLVAGQNFAGGIVTFTPAAAQTYTFTYAAVDASGAQSAPATVTVTVSSAELITPQKTIFTQAKARWTLGGTDSPLAGQTITMMYDPATPATYKVNGQCTGNAAGTVIGSAVVDGLGNYLYDQLLVNTSGVQNPTNTAGNSTGFWCTPPKTMRMTSTLSNVTVTQAISLK
ncbi:MAG TPA: cadherin-like domain-containing protein [Terriglobales bacterium]